MLLPETISEADYDATRHDEARWRSAADAIFSRHAVAGEVHRLGGTALVWRCENRVLKLFAPMWTQSWRGERTALEAVSGKLGVETPEIVAEGDLDGWPYLLMTHLGGRPLDEAWPTLDVPSRRRAAEEVGMLLGRLHRLPPPSDASLQPPGGWWAFLDAQAGIVVERQRKRGLAEDACQRPEAEMDALVEMGRGAPGISLLHTEIGPSHVLCDETGRPSGVLDFADALVGPPAYDLVAAAVFVARGDPSLYSILGKAAGEHHDPGLMWAFTVLHRYANLPWYLRETGLPDLDALARIYHG